MDTTSRREALTTEFLKLEMMDRHFQKISNAEELELAREIFERITVPEEEKSKLGFAPDGLENYPNGEMRYVSHDDTKDEITIPALANAPDWYKEMLKDMISGTRFLGDRWK